MEQKQENICVWRIQNTSIERIRFSNVDCMQN